ncbi:hypothetical protein N7516_008067 [Penicillium verrucosum]|uniref:uncharacterized protein n=1 Tax=Penicillium verrucosum TaxID=60171 RepID=UPI0025456D97|nr:uncharacterized protein N7516_008067 [Penicillium verrucosum]KAJ5926294.1 hypothetical protein N7516_008067 [Penicillium verrucosum]
MTNQENMRGNPNPKSNTPVPAPSPSASTSFTPSNKPPSTSAPPRVLTSLAKSAFQPSPDLANTLASSTSSKPAGPSSSLPNTQTSRDLSANTTPHGAPGSGSGSGSGSSYAAQSFREHDTHTSTPGGFTLPALTEDEFQGNTHAYGYDGIGIADNTEAHQLRANTTTTTADQNTNQSQSQFQSQDLQTPSSTWKGKARAHDPTQHQLETVWQRQWHEQTPQTTTVPATDGAAVVSLLSDITFDPNFEDPTTVPDTEIDIAAPPAPLSAAEREMLDSFRRGLGLDVEGKGNKEREKDARLTGASLIPDIDVFLSQGLGAESSIGSGTGTETGERNAMAMATDSGSGSGFIPTSIRDAVLRNMPGGTDWIGVQETDIDVFLSQGIGAGTGIGKGNTTAMGSTSTSTSTSTSLRDAVLANLPGAGDWIGVQERYHDEVWGYLQPVLEDARAEIEEKGVEGLGAGEDGPAVRRLKMILMHMKG